MTNTEIRPIWGGTFPFWAIFCIFLHFGGYSGDWWVLGVLASYKIARGIKLALGRVNNWVLGGFEGVLVGLGGSKRVCLTPIGHFLPLWKPCMTPDLVPNTT